MNHIKVQLKSTGRSEHILSQDDECVTAMNSIPPSEIMCRVHIADQVHRMLSSGQKGYWIPASPVMTSPGPEPQESRLFSASRKTSSRKPKISEPIGTGRMRREEVKALHGRLPKGNGYHQWLDPGAM